MKKLGLSTAIVLLTSLSATAAEVTLHCTFGIVRKNLRVDFDNHIVTDLDNGRTYRAKITITYIEWYWTMGDQRGTTAVINRFTAESSNIFRFGDGNTGLPIQPWTGKCQKGGPIIGPG